MKNLNLIALAFASNVAIAQSSSIDVFGVTLSIGMSEQEVRDAFPDIYCTDSCLGGDDVIQNCTIDDGIPPGTDASVRFQNSRVIRASKHWFLAKDASPYDALQALNSHLQRIGGEDNGVCAKIESFSGPYNQTTNFVFPEKVLSIKMMSLRGENFVFEESLRVNPVPEEYKVRGKKSQGREWCGYVN